MKRDRARTVEEREENEAWTRMKAKDGRFSRRVYLQIMANCTHGQPETRRSLNRRCCWCSSTSRFDPRFVPSFRKREEEKRGEDRWNWERTKVKRNGGDREIERGRERDNRDGTEISTTTKQASNDLSTSVLSIRRSLTILVETVDDDDGFYLVIYAGRLRNTVVKS